MAWQKSPARRRWVWGVLAATVLTVLVGATLVCTALGPSAGDLHLSIDGEAIDLHNGHWLLAAAGMLLGTLVVLLVLPLALLLGVAMPLALAGFGLLAALAVGLVALALLGSPFILLGLLVWWAARPARAARSAAPAARPVVPRVGQHTDNTTPLA